MVWIDEVLSSDGKEALCRVSLKPGSHFFGENGIRQSCAIEWVAQAYGYGWGASGNVELKKTYLAAFNDVEYCDPQTWTSASREPYLLVTVKLRKVLMPIIIVSGEVCTESGAVLARVKIKVFVEK